MCGICGIFSFNDNGVDRREIINEMTTLMLHRGPDDDGYYFSDIHEIRNKKRKT